MRWCTKIVKYEAWGWLLLHQKKAPCPSPFHWPWNKDNVNIIAMTIFHFPNSLDIECVCLVFVLHNIWRAEELKSLTENCSATSVILRFKFLWKEWRSHLITCSWAYPLEAFEEPGRNLETWDMSFMYFEDLFTFEEQKPLYKTRKHHVTR